MTYNEQLSFLANEKGLIINDPDKALLLLKHHSYFALINGYKHLFKKKGGKYKGGTKIEDIYYLYSFDNCIRQLLLNSIMEVELYIKSLLSYAFCEKYGEDENAYLSALNYDYGNPKHQGGINKLIQVLTKTIKDYQDFHYMKHQKDSHGNIPLWVMVKALTLGNISKMYHYQKPDIQTKISKEFDGVSEGDLVAFLDLLTRLRNVCAHNERLFDYKYNKGCINDMPAHDALGIPKVKGQYQKGKSDLFAGLIALKYLLTQEKHAVLMDEIAAAIETLLEKTNQVQREQLYKAMGFPLNWIQLKTINVGA